MKLYGFFPVWQTAMVDFQVFFQAYPDFIIAANDFDQYFVSFEQILTAAFALTPYFLFWVSSDFFWTNTVIILSIQPSWSDFLIMPEVILFVSSNHNCNVLPYSLLLTTLLLITCSSLSCIINTKQAPDIPVARLRACKYLGEMW